MDQRMFFLDTKTQSVVDSARELEQSAKELETNLLRWNFSDVHHVPDTFRIESSTTDAISISPIRDWKAEIEIHQLSELESEVDQKLRSIDAHHAHIDFNREEIEYLGNQIDELLESM